MKNHGGFGKWLMQDEQKDLWEIFVALAINVLFLALMLLAVWPLGKAWLAFRLAQGYGVLWILTLVVALLGNRIQEYFRVNIYDRPNAFVISNLMVSCLLQVAWSAFAAFTIQRFVPGTPVWIAVILWGVGVLSCVVAFFAVSSFYQGHIYKLVSLPLMLIGFIIFAVWPAAGRVIAGGF